MAQVEIPDRLLIRPLAVGADALRRLAYSDPESFPVLLDSAARGPLSRYSILAAYPQATLWQDGRGRLHTTGMPAPATSGFLSALEAAWRSQGRAQPAEQGEAAPGPFRGGWVVFLGYELAAEIEPQLNLAPRVQSDAAAPSAFALRIPAGLVYDHVAQQAWLFAQGGREDLLEALSVALAALPAGSQPTRTRVLVEEEAPHRFRARVEAALDYIGAGDIYQANLSRPWRGELERNVPLSAATMALYERLRAVNPAPFAALAQFQNWRLLSSSPERLVRVGSGRVETRPIAGTRPRSGAAGEDQREIAALIAHPKERAEHVMLIDLERNDLGRICRAGSVHVDEFMRIESYPHVHHIVSNVAGELLPQLTPIEVLRAVFPGGTITGCPKFRCMQIIAELEAEARQAYTGGIGFINPDGSMDFNILIRSLTLHERRVEFRTGAGIVADSDWQRELTETRAKARGLLAALADA
ncbi:MAG TPA: aminodeoxychorismate synthase component I [Steroidobacteraceae bacterium]|nr:aminodeoxychorismate synthase component I [Steroidobacteraceae bacterium]